MKTTISYEAPLKFYTNSELLAESYNVFIDILDRAYAKPEYKIANSQYTLELSDIYFEFETVIDDGHASVNFTVQSDLESFEGKNELENLITEAITEVLTDLNTQLEKERVLKLVPKNQYLLCEDGSFFIRVDAETAFNVEYVTIGFEEKDLDTDQIESMLDDVDVSF